MSRLQLLLLFSACWLLVSAAVAVAVAEAVQ